MKRMKLVLIGAAFGAALFTLPQSGWSYSTDVCGPMCHRPGDHQTYNKEGYKHLDTRQGSFYAMKRRFDIQPSQEEAWNRFQTAVLTRLSDAFDAEKVTFDRNKLTKSPTDYNEENYEPVLTDPEIKSWNNVLTTFNELRAVLDEDRRKAVDRIRAICKTVK